jgi:hypothetical protein
MKYPLGETVKTGDTVDVGNGLTGVVVAVIDPPSYSVGYPASEWAYLTNGVLVETGEAGLVHVSEADSDFVLISCASRI